MKSNKELLVEISELKSQLTVANSLVAGTFKNKDSYNLNFGNTSEIIQSIDPDGEILFVSQAWKDILGYSDEEIKHLNIFDIIHPDHLESCKEQFRQIMDGQFKYNFSTVIVSSSKKKIFLKGVIFPQFINDKVVATHSFFQNVSEENKFLEKSKEIDIKFQKLTETANDAIVILNHKALTIFWNNAATSIFGFSADEMIGKDLHNLIVPDRYLDSYRKGFAKFTKTGKGVLVNQTTEVVAKKKDGQEFPISISMSSLILDNKWHAVGIIRDLTELKKSQEQLVNSEAKLSKFFHEAPIGLAINSMDGKFVDINEEFVKISGYSVSQLNKLSYWDLTPKKYFADEEIQLKDLKEKHIYGPYEKEYIHKKGYLVPVSLKGFIISSEGEDFIWSIVEDLTERKQNEDRIKSLAGEVSQFIDTANAPIFGINSKGKINEWNQTSEKITGYTKEDVMGKGLVDEFITEDYRKSVKKVLDNALKGIQTSNYEFPLYSRDGEKIMILLNASTRRDIQGKIIGVIGVGQDITELSNHRENLENLVKTRTKELEASLEREQELGKMKTSFVSMASHEFRTPLTAIKATADVILRYQEQLSKNDVEKRLHKIINEVGDMTIMLDDILIMGKADSQRLEFNPTNLNIIALVKEIIEDYQLSQEVKREVIIQSSSDQLLVNADPKWIKHIVNNLFSNAIKYSEAPKPIEISIGLENQMVCLIIKDYGIGINKTDHDSLFEPFVRGVNVGVIAGAGLGLAVMKKGVDLHHGAISFNSEIGKGTSFKVLLPILISQ